MATSLATLALQATSTASPSVYFIASTNLPSSEEAVETDRVPSILLVLMILLLPSIAISFGVAIWIVRRIRSIPTPDVESKFSTRPDIGLSNRKFNLSEKYREFSDISGDTLTMNTPIPIIRVISKSPSRDNESLDVDLEKLDFAEFTPDATSTLPRRTKDIRGAIADHDKDGSKDMTSSGESDSQMDPALARAFSCFGISPVLSSPVKEAVPLVSDRYPAPWRV
ncbi:hypothetical protein EUX98_g1690 [Antrodiella citrinella]|uniref:Uncharacterized protein n=1 Tax=Antrodiella citrinella TaxID=2447956 RepID=A0A4S4N0U0_9APHY|nr:hypothetical protein EUX98_g1690 [Antrodiella citrinella]